jgi:hypothetical protein
VPDAPPTGTIPVRDRRSAPPPQASQILAPGPYGPPAGYPVPYPPPRPPTNKFAIASLVLGILGVWPLTGFASILAAAFGFLAYSQVHHAAGAQTGREMAVAGIALSVVGLVVLAAVLILNPIL